MSVLNLKKLEKKDFDKYLNTSYTVAYKAENNEEKKIELELVEISEKDRENVYSFSLVFKGPTNVVLSDNTYIFKHKNMGELSMHISPFQQDGNNVFYDVIFSRLKEEI